MLLKINNVEIAAYPAPEGFTATVLDLDNEETTERTLDTVLHRDRLGVKRQIELKFNALQWSEISAILKSIKAESFLFYYPDPMEGDYVTKRMYVGNRSAPFAIDRNGEIWWGGLTMTFTEV